MAQTGARVDSALKKAKATQQGTPLSPDLPFVRLFETSDPKLGVNTLYDHWCVPETGDPVADVELGRAMALRAAAYFRAHPDRQGLMGNVFLSMIRNGRIGGVEVGFGAGLAEALGRPHTGGML
jgi:hypothetical protein